ncbi:MULTISPECIES: carbohydrate ABC transporter permease [Streptomyces]|uniref:Carbohydrate ABC transporter permease n=2 Tax=Streptomyces rimosus subsp. rimosus TaxID=132474 RepID=L8EHE1_STRR1|nr:MULTISPECIES: carbohydrate ABC transporter permease [Streptomyces]KOG70317.1 ABC transporter permease [Kitasatospora aureofaciens]MYT48887.1 ABC transporter permease subunit [Streptomyces sp. SID5471]KEF18339.1 ABC transporter permease [Streptomyces rimosus]KOT32309.1 ABC transporter permease [Streptomyces sp. NRRL WC-3701]KOT33391.1 ABC transporter permease [Streptomyces rimosus subsp. rimosus]
MRRRGRVPWLSYLLVGLGAVVTVVPFLDMLLTSFKGPGEYGRLPYRFLPEAFDLSNYREAFVRLDLPLLFRNSVVATAVITGSVLLTSSLAGYALAKLRFPGRDVIFRLVLATMMFPPFVFFIPHFLILVHWPLAGGNGLLGEGGAGLTVSLAALVMPFLVSGFGIFLMRQFIVSVPDEMLEAARIDGAGEFTVWWRIVVPQTRPVAVTLALLTFVGAWNEYIWALLVSTANPRLMTLPVGIQTLQSYLDPNRMVPVMMAGLMLSVLPVLLLFLLLQKHYIRGVMLSGLK